MKLNPWWLYHRARLYALLKRNEQAVSDLREVLRLDPACVRAASLLGFVYATLGRRELAVEQFKNALKLDPDNAVLLFDLGYI